MSDIEKISESLNSISSTLKNIESEFKKQNKKGITHYVKYLHFVYAAFICFMLFISDKDHQVSTQMIENTYALLQLAEN